jgi:hypothetical protein
MARRATKSAAGHNKNMKYDRLTEMSAPRGTERSDRLLELRLALCRRDWDEYDMYRDHDCVAGMGAEFGSETCLIDLWRVALL